ncbi:hypothetical protein MBM_06069 [Drepanopeziza brunnea f. sp. 'multigermtubi' MB_m1]|uniref:Protein kinase domain-containing protein n=1 Tax=Marssonina brunnea f. sp. multigermtubi (strain MB_m1) TaxID=1072389 RepID=K1X5X8_MARBU|nr:uncharacterized protein MBM_06069 [Drepanopeziza brunnea f. sp. 'multigermtubi' MB_m1]EKD16058.1 hypothetical protein MBM_06069 [Drepanopeziza brunnea f. sp. 'multigermtubi' MB_m1]
MDLDSETRENEKWLATEWRYLGADWRGTRILGEGAFGKAGLWEGDPARAPPLTEVVVKRTVINNFSGAEALDEGINMALLAKFRSKHILRMYGPPRRNANVIHLFLEYCPGGDLGSFTGDYRPGGWLEADLWAMFQCLVLGVSTMDHGSEDETVNFNDMQIGHNEYEPLADFGESVQYPSKYQTGIVIDSNGRPFHGRGDPQWQAPEMVQFFGDAAANPNQLLHSRKGTCSNIFQVGCVMHSLVTGARRNTYANPSEHRVSTCNANLLRGGTHGQDMEDARYAGYSQTLRELIMECMMREPPLRPTSQQAKERVASGLAFSLRAFATILQFKTNKGLVDVPYRYVDPEPPEDLLVPEDEAVATEAATQARQPAAGA